MRILLLLVLLFTILAARAQPAIRVTQIAEAAEGLSQPHDAALSPDGRLLYVTDMRNSRLRVFSALTLKPVSTFGEGELSYPHDCEFDGAGRLLVADTGNDRIAIYDVKGAKPVLAGELKGLSGPEGVAVAADGRVIVTNTRSGTLAVFRDGKLERTVGRHGAGAGEFANPHDVEVAADGSIHVVDSGNNRVQVLDAALKPQAINTAALGLSGPKYLSFDEGTIWLADEYNHRLLKLDRQYRLLGILGGERGRTANRFNKPEAVVARAPHLWVIDTYNDRILLLRID
jgi:sugar lactone lactonase YvrE